MSSKTHRQTEQNGGVAENTEGRTKYGGGDGGREQFEHRVLCCSVLYIFFCLPSSSSPPTARPSVIITHPRLSTTGHLKTPLKVGTSSHHM